MKKTILLLVMAAFSLATAAQTIKTVGGATADYLTLKAAFDAINTGAITGDIVLQVIANSSEASGNGGLVTLNASGTGTEPNISSYSSVLIYPTAPELTIQGNTNSTLKLTLNGADNVIIDGRLRDANGVVQNQNKELSFFGTAGTITFTNDACNNTIKYCNIKNYNGNNPIGFSAGTAPLTGNDNNIISHNNISGGSTSTRYGIVVEAGTAGKENDNNIISYNNIFNVLAPGSNGYFIGLSNYNKDWTISNNSFYLTNPLTLTHTNTNQIINLGGTNNSGHIVENNYIGGNGPQCEGTMQINKSTSSSLPIDMISIVKGAANTTKVTVRNNTIKNIQVGANATGTIRAIVGVGNYNNDPVINEIDANFISNIDILGSSNFTGIHVGTNGDFATTNNIISLITNGSGIIIGINEDCNNNANKRYTYNNTVYIGGSANSNNYSAAYNYLQNGANTRRIKNNIFVNVRSNEGEGKNYAIWYNTTAAAAVADYNVYYVSGTNSVLARYNGASGSDVAELPILTGDDVNSRIINPNFTISSPTTPFDYYTSISEITEGAIDYVVSKDFAGTTRGAIPSIGAFELTTVVPTVPGTPIIGTAMAGNANASVEFTAPVSDGGSAIIHYTVTSDPGGITATGTASPITVTGLTNGVEYTFTITATNVIGTSLASVTSNAVTPSIGTDIPETQSYQKSVIVMNNGIQIYEKSQVDVFSFTGELVWTGISNGNIIPLPKGVYVVKMVIGEKSEVKKVIVR